MNTKSELLVYTALQNIFNASMDDIDERAVNGRHKNLYTVYYDDEAVFRIFWNSRSYEVKYLALELDALYSIQIFKARIGDGIQKVLEDLYYNYTCKVIDKFKEVRDHKYICNLALNNRFRSIYIQSRNFTTCNLPRVRPNLDSNPNKMTISLVIRPKWTTWSRNLNSTEIGSYDNLLDLLDRLEEADQTLDDEFKYLESLGFNPDPYQVMLSYYSPGVNLQIYPCGGMSDFDEYFLYVNEEQHTFNTLDELIDFIVRGGD